MEGAENLCLETYRDERLVSIPGWWGQRRDCLFPRAAGIVQSEEITKGITWEKKQTNTKKTPE